MVDVLVVVVVVVEDEGEDKLASVSGVSGNFE